jgi:hypothetical protein
MISPLLRRRDVDRLRFFTFTPGDAAVKQRPVQLFLAPVLETITRSLVSGFRHVIYDFADFGTMLKGLFFSELFHTFQ